MTPSQKYTPSLRTMYGFGPSRITRGEIASVKKIFEQFSIGDNNSLWECNQEALRVEVSSASENGRSYVFNFIKLRRPKHLIFSQRVWLIHAQGGWEPIRHRWVQWEEDMAYILRLVIKDGRGLSYSSGGDAILAVKDHVW